jgi:hypothetical protein
VPRGYVWLNGPNGLAPDSDCMIDLDVGDWGHSFTLSGLFTSNCVTKLQTLRATGQPVLVPIYDQLQPAVLSVTPGYHIVGFAPFVITGYTSVLPGLTGALTSTISGGSLTTVLNKTLCGLSNCIYGYFTKSLVPMVKPKFGTGSNFGATVIGRTG